jgi:hypothetical protein
MVFSKRFLISNAKKWRWIVMQNILIDGVRKVNTQKMALVVYHIKNSFSFDFYIKFSFLNLQFHSQKSQQTHSFTFQISNDVKSNNDHSFH